MDTCGDPTDADQYGSHHERQTEPFVEVIHTGAKCREQSSMSGRKRIIAPMNNKRVDILEGQKRSRRGNPVLDEIIDPPGKAYGAEYQNKLQSFFLYCFWVTIVTMLMKKKKYECDNQKQHPEVLRQKDRGLTDKCILKC